MKLAILLLTTFLASEAGAFYPAIGPLVGSAGMAEWLKSQQENNNGGLTNGQLDAINTMPCSNPGDASCSLITGQPPAKGMLPENVTIETFGNQQMRCIGPGAGAMGPPDCRPCDDACVKELEAQGQAERQKEVAKLKKNDPSVATNGGGSTTPTPTPNTTASTGGQSEDLIALTNGGGVMAGLTQDSDKKSTGGKGGDTRSGNPTGGAYDPQGATAVVPQPSTDLNGQSLDFSDNLAGQIADATNGLGSGTVVSGKQAGQKGPGYTHAGGGAGGGGGGGSQQGGGSFVIDCKGSFESICSGGQKASDVAFETARKLGSNLDKDAKGAGFQGTGTGNKSFGKQ